MGLRLRTGKLGELPMDSEKLKRIAQRAYLFWKAEGQPHGRHEEHWHRAARQIEAEEEVHIAGKPRTKAFERATAKPAGKKSKK